MHTYPMHHINHSPCTPHGAMHSFLRSMHGRPSIMHGACVAHAWHCHVSHRVSHAQNTSSYASVPDVTCEHDHACETKIPLHTLPPLMHRTMHAWPRQNHCRRQRTCEKLLLILDHIESSHAHGWATSGNGFHSWPATRQRCVQRHPVSIAHFSSDGRRILSPPTNVCLMESCNRRPLYKPSTYAAVVYTVRLGAVAITVRSLYCRGE